MSITSGWWIVTYNRHISIQIQYCTVNLVHFSSLEQECYQNQLTISYFGNRSGESKQRSVLVKNCSGNHLKYKGQLRNKTCLTKSTQDESVSTNLFFRLQYCRMIFGGSSGYLTSFGKPLFANGHHFLKWSSTMMRSLQP